MKRRLLLFFLFVSSLLTAQNNIYRSGGITQTVGAPTFVPGASGNIVAIDTVTGEWYVNPNRLSGSSWISAGYRLTNISGSVPPAYTPTAHQSHLVINAANQMYYWDGAAWQNMSSTDATRLKFLVVNKSGGTLNKGDVVYVSGAQGNRVAVKKALAIADSLSATTLGVMDGTVANNNEGYCVAEGLVTGLNTSAFTEGAALYLSPTTAGAITQTKPTAPNHLVLIGYCVKSNNASGEISVHIDNGYELGELHDVYIPAPTNGQVLTYDATDSRWEAATVADQSATNELQTIDTFSLSGQTLSASLSSDAQPAKTVTLPVVNVTAGTGISVSSATGNYTVTNSAPDQTVSITNGGGITPSGTYPNFTLTAADQSATNELQTLSTGINTLTLSNGGGTVTVDTDPTNDVTGSGANGQVSYWSGTQTQTGDAGLKYDASNDRLMVGPITSATFPLEIFRPGTAEAYGISISTTSPGIRQEIKRGTGGAAFSLFDLRALKTGDSTNAIWGAVGVLGSFTTSPPTVDYMYFGSNSNVAYDNNALRIYPNLNIRFDGNLGNVTTPAARLHVVGSGSTSGSWTAQFHNSAGNNNALMIRDDGRVAMGTATPDASAILTVTSTTGGILFPRMTTAQRDAITTPANGLVIYNTTTDKLQVRAGGAWVDLH